MKYIFIGFYGWSSPEIDQEDKIYEIGKDFELWNLRKFSTSDFIESIKIRIPPVNENVLKYYITEKSESIGLTKEECERSLWGILLPDPDNIHYSGYSEVLSLLNLFSPQYMKPDFYITNSGIHKIKNFNKNEIKANNYQGHNYFISKKFITFYELLIKEMKYFIWDRDVVIKWSKEDWRLYMASIFYKGLEEYEESKSYYTWQRESADMATLLETLFTAGDASNEEIGYRLRKRIAVLIQWKYNEIEKDIKILYKDRSEFIHGSYYIKIISEMKKNENDNAVPPVPDFDKLYKSKEQIRFIFISYLYIHKIFESKSEPLFQKYDNVQNMLEEAIIDINLRSKITELTKQIIEPLT